MSCHLVERGSVECDVPEGGTEARLILMNFDDVLKIYTNDEGRIVSVFMNPGTIGYEFLGFRQDVKKSEEVASTNLKNRFSHATGCVIYEVDQVQKNNIKSMSKGRFMAIVENKGNDENSFELLGRECGLKMTAGLLRSAHETKGTFVISLQTPDNGVEFERKLPQLLGTTYAEGSQIVDDILGLLPSENLALDYDLDFNL